MKGCSRSYSNLLFQQALTLFKLSIQVWAYLCGLWFSSLIFRALCGLFHLLVISDAIEPPTGHLRRRMGFPRPSCLEPLVRRRESVALEHKVYFSVQTSCGGIPLAIAIYLSGISRLGWEILRLMGKDDIVPDCFWPAQLLMNPTHCSARIACYFQQGSCSIQERNEPIWAISYCQVKSWDIPGLDNLP